eukprot:5551238-Pyramimonas_sp.AAC.1
MARSRRWQTSAGTTRPTTRSSTRRTPRGWTLRRRVGMRSTKWTTATSSRSSSSSVGSAFHAP